MQYLIAGLLALIGLMAFAGGVYYELFEKKLREMEGQDDEN